MDRQTRKLLRDALDAAGEILDYTRDLDLETFAVDRRRRTLPSLFSEKH